MTELWFLGLKSHVWLCPNLLDRILEVKCEWLADSIFFFFFFWWKRLRWSKEDEPSQNFFLFLPYHIYTLVQFKWDPIKSSAKCSALDCFAVIQVHISLNLSKSDNIMRLQWFAMEETWWMFLWISTWRSGSHLMNNSGPKNKFLNS